MFQIMGQRHLFGTTAKQPQVFDRQRNIKINSVNM